MSKDGKKIVVCGCHESGIPTVRALIKAGFSVAAIVSISEELAKKALVSGYVDFEPLAKEFKIPFYSASRYDLNCTGDIDFFAKNKFDLLVQGGWQRLFPSGVLENLSIGAIGSHGSSDPLPKGRGRSPLNWSLIERKKRFYIDLFLIKEGIDDGDIFNEACFDVLDYDDVRTLYYKASIVHRQMLVESIPKLLDGTFKTRKQGGIPSYYPKRGPHDGRIDWERMDVWYIDALIRASTQPYPGAFGVLDGKPYRIWRAQVFDTRIQYQDTKYGEVVERFEDRLVVYCRGGLLLINEIESMSDEEFKTLNVPSEYHLLSYEEESSARTSSRKKG